MTKITPEHLVRDAVVYVRQSTAFQVARNLESQRRQYGLTGRARQLGWPDVAVIDDDLGRSGAGARRPGFERLLAAICEGRVGAVFSLEASRLARNGRDWHTLLEFCGLVGTLIVDEDGVYDPARQRANSSVATPRFRSPRGVRSGARRTCQAHGVRAARCGSPLIRSRGADESADSNSRSSALTAAATSSSRANAFSVSSSETTPSSSSAWNQWASEEPSGHPASCHIWYARNSTCSRVAMALPPSERGRRTADRWCGSATRGAGASFPCLAASAALPRDRRGLRGRRGQGHP